MTGDREKLISLIQQANQSQQKGMTQQAANILKAALALSPHDYDIMLQLGSIYYSLGRPEDAILYFNGALKIKPTDIRLL